jgi:hypothetical protein
VSVDDIERLGPVAVGDLRGLRRAGWLVLVGCGLVAFVVAVVAAVPGTAGLIPVDGLVALAGNDYFLLGAFGTLALAVLSVMVVRRAAGHVKQAAPPDPETIRDAHQPGDELDQYLQSWSLSNGRAANEALRERLRTAAVSAMVRTERVPAETARERIDEGEWTDDPVVAAFLSSGRPTPPGLHEEAALALHGERWNQHEVREATEAVLERFELDGERR